LAGNLIAGGLVSSTGKVIVFDAEHWDTPSD
jgi:hypothetical protein